MKDSILHLHVLCEDWLRELRFYKNEIPFFRTRLEAIAPRYTSTEVLAEVEHFENKFRILDTHCDELLHDVKLKHQSIISEATARPNYIGVKMIEADEKIPELMEYTANDFASTKREFYNFLSRYM